MKAALLLTVPMLLVGCVIAPTGSHIASNTARLPLAPSQVEVFSSIPTNAVTVGLVTARAYRGVKNSEDQEVLDQALGELKRQAGLMGGNGLKISRGRILRDRIWVNGTAFYVEK